MMSNGCPPTSVNLQARTHFQTIIQAHLTGREQISKFCTTLGSMKSIEVPSMPDNRLHADGARVLADLHALRSIGAFKTGVHKPTFSEPHMRSLEWLAQRLAEAGLTVAIDGIGNVLGTATRPGPKLLAGSHLEARISPAGSMGRLASCMPSKPPELSIPTRTQTARLKSLPGAMRKAISAVSWGAGLTS